MGQEVADISSIVNEIFGFVAGRAQSWDRLPIFAQPTGMQFFLRNRLWTSPGLSGGVDAPEVGSVILFKRFPTAPELMLRAAPLPADGGCRPRWWSFGLLVDRTAPSVRPPWQRCGLARRGVVGEWEIVSHLDLLMIGSVPWPARFITSL